MERPIVMAFGISLACHTVLLGMRVLHLRVVGREQQRRALEVIYEAQLAQQDIRQLQHQQLAALGESQDSVPAVEAPAPHVRIPERSVVSLPPTASEASVSRGAVVDLTNLVDAAQGNPMLLSYFGAIREQIQRTANQQAWATGKIAQGLVYVSFVLNRTGQVRSVEVLSDRSATSQGLHDIATRIIRAAAPFPQFPPSIPDATKTVVVPLEFLLGS
ncbi:MAG: TonB family protein [Candidatus Omnitrophica bacterium]|nr:TonB family protein [Candidatus Omnitrophota bacterium]